MNNQVIFSHTGGHSRLPRLEDKRADRSPAVGDHHLSDSGAHSAGPAHHRAVEAGLLQTQQTRPHALREPGEEQP